MEDWFLIPTMAAMFAFGFFLVRRLDAFIAENRQRIAEEEHRNSRCIRICAESSGLLEDISAALEDCSHGIPYMEFFLSSGPRGPLLGRLLNGSLDIALLWDACPESLPPECRWVRIPHSSCPEEAESILLVWNRELPSKDRDRVVYMIENACPAAAASR